jgi:hypothetical protein
LIRDLCHDFLALEEFKIPLDTGLDMRPIDVGLDEDKLAADVASGIQEKILACKADYDAFVEQRIDAMTQYLRSKEGPLVLIANSASGPCAVSAAEVLMAEGRDVRGVFFIAPAFYMYFHADQSLKSQVPIKHVLHGFRDERINADNAIRFEKENPDVVLTLLDTDHYFENVLDKLMGHLRDFVHVVRNENS